MKWSIKKPGTVMGRKVHSGLLLLACCLPYASFAEGIVSDNPLELMGAPMNFSGTVIKKTCELALASEDQTVHMREEDVKNLYRYGWGLKQPFEIQLLHCDTAILNDVAVTFTGAEDAELPGRLKVNGADSVAIALFAQQGGGIFLPLGTAAEAQQLSSGDNILRFDARIEAHPSAVRDKSIKVGSFQAVAHFTLTYE